MLLQGRSGTGKTLCCIYAMLHWYQHMLTYRDYPEYRMPNLVFLTKSADLCRKVAAHFSALANAAPESGGVRFTPDTNFDQVFAPCSCRLPRTPRGCGWRVFK